jgi:hypothetical protein
MLLMDLAYRRVTEPRRSGFVGGKSAAATPSLAYFMDQGYIATQVLAIRKLLDKGKNVI